MRNDLGYKGIGEECNGNINSDDRITVREGMNKLGTTINF